MFEAVELGQSLDKDDFKSRENQYRIELLEMQRQLRAAEVATLIIVSGVSTAGKGHVVNRLNKWFDSRGMETHAFWDETDEELERPQEWRYWKRLPPRGSIAVMFDGWYGPAFRDQQQSDDIGDPEPPDVFPHLSGSESVFSFRFFGPGRTSFSWHGI